MSAAPALAAPALVPLGTFAQPTWAGSPPGDRARVFVTERAGRIQVIEDGVARTFMDLTRNVLADASERGLLSLAFPADYAQSGKFYAYVTARPAGAIEVHEYTGTELTPRVLVSIAHTDASNHNGGQLQFGPEGGLWLGTGDGGGGNDQFDHAQDPSSRLGKLLRIDVATGDVELKGVGLRNPWRFSFAPSGDIVIADVGQNAIEEVTVGLATNYGWPCLEGTRPGPRPDDPRCTTGTAAPVIEKTRGDGFCSIVGGYVVRDPGLPTLHGRYVYGDWCADGLRTANLAPPIDDRPVGIDVAGLSSFGEDACGRVLVVSLNGPVSRIVDGAATPCEPEEPTPTPTATATGTATATATPTATATATPTATPRATVTPTPTVTPQAQPAAATPTPAPAAVSIPPAEWACTPRIRVTGLWALAKRRYLAVALRTDKPCRVRISARHFRRVTVNLTPGERRVVKLRRIRGKAKRIAITVRLPGGRFTTRVRAR